MNSLNVQHYTAETLPTLASFTKVPTDAKPEQAEWKVAPFIAQESDGNYRRALFAAMVQLLDMVLGRDKIAVVTATPEGAPVFGLLLVAPDAGQTTFDGIKAIGARQQEREAKVLAEILAHVEVIPEGLQEEVLELSGGASDPGHDEVIAALEHLGYEDAGDGIYARDEDTLRSALN